MGFFDDFVNKTKDTIDVVSKKTSDAVNIQKYKLDVSSLENKKEKDYAKLGIIYYNMIKDSDSKTPDESTILKAIEEKNVKIRELNAKISRLQNTRFCANCGAAIAKDARFCNNCGAEVTFDTNNKNAE